MQNSTNIISSTNKNGEIELLRFIFCVSIIFTHLNSHFNLNAFYRGSFGVEFFFIVSGFFMAKTAERITDDNYTINTFEFIKKKICAFLPYYIGALLIHFIVFKVLIQKIDLEYIFVHGIKLIPELMLLQMGGFATESQFNIPAVWYLSAMILAMLILYPLTIKLKKSYGIIYLIISIFGLGYIVKEYGGVAAFRTTDIGLCYHGMLRAICEIALGAACYQICGIISERQSCTKKSRKVLLTVLKFCGYVAVGLFVFSSLNSLYESAALIVLTICFILTNSGLTYNIPYNRAIGWIGKLTLPLYLFHSIVFLVIASIFGNSNKSIEYLTVVLTVVAISSIIFKLLVDYISESRKMIAVVFGIAILVVSVSLTINYLNKPVVSVDSSMAVNDYTSVVRFTSNSELNEDFYISEDCKLEKIEFYTITWNKQFEDDQTLQIVIRDKQSEELLYTETLNMSEFTDARAYSLEPETSVKFSAQKWYTIEYIDKTSEGQQYMAMMLTDVSNNTEGTTYINGEIVEGHIAMKLWTKG